MSVREIAEQEGIHPASLAKILHMLCWQGLVHSKRGRQGGFWLARDPSHIGLKEVVQIFQGPWDSPGPPGEQGFAAAWQSLYAPTRRSLERMTVADLLRFGLESDGPRARKVSPRRVHAKPYVSREGAQ